MFPFGTVAQTRKQPASRVQLTTYDLCKKDQSTSEMPMTEDPIISAVQFGDTPSTKQCLSSPEELQQELEKKKCTDRVTEKEIEILTTNI